MTTKTQSQFLKNQGSAMRRTATSVRGIAAGVKDPASIQALLKAAQIIEAEAGQVITRHKQAVAEEKRYEAAKAKALPVARELVKQLPMSTTAEKLAVMNEGFNCAFMVDTIYGHTNSKPTPERLQRELDESLETIANDLAHVSAKTGRAPEISDLFLARMQRYSKLPNIAQAAALFDRINAEVAPC